MPRKRRIEPEEHKPATHSEMGGGHPEREYIRSLTPRGFAEAVYLANVDAVRTGKVSTRLTETTEEPPYASRYLPLPRLPR